MNRDSVPVSATEWSLWSTRARLVVTDPDQLRAARRLAQWVLADVDRAASRFRDDSELLTLGRDADGGVDLSPTLAGLLRHALDAAELSGGAVDPTVATTLLDLGYDRDIALVRRGDSVVRTTVRTVPGWRSLELRGHRLFRPRGLQLDLGATAKAVAADWVARQVTDELGTGVLVSIGGDIATAGPAPEGGWQVRVQDVDEDPVAHIGLSCGAVATSSTVRRTWERNGRTYHHIVDPATSQPVARVWRSVTVVAPTCAEANTLSTGALVKGHDAPAWLGRLGRPARLLDASGRVHLLGGWPEEVQAA